MLTAKCIGCGCTDDHTCVENDQPCHWLSVNRVEGVGACSSCPDAFDQDGVDFLDRSCCVIDIPLRSQRLNQCFS